MAFNDLKSWAKEIIFSDKEDQLFDYVLLEKLWNEHEQGIFASPSQNVEHFDVKIMAE